MKPLADPMTRVDFVNRPDLIDMFRSVFGILLNGAYCERFAPEKNIIFKELH